MRKKLLLLAATFLLSFTIGTITAQTTKGQKSPVTTTMAKKIGSYCQYNQRALSLFAVANPQQVRNRTDLASRLLETLDKHLDCAENFIVTLYYNYGVEMAYFALKDAGFTIKETDVAEAIWKKEKEKRDKIAQEQEARKKAERELGIQKRINENDEFAKKELASEATINWNGIRSAYDSHVSPLFETSNLDSRMYYVHIDKEGTLVADKNDDSFINKYVLSILESNRHTPAKILFKNDSVSVKTEIPLKAKSIGKEYTLNVKKSKKGWELKKDVETNSERVKTVISELIKLLNSNSDLSQLKNRKYQIKANIVTHCLDQKIFVQETDLRIYSTMSSMKKIGAVAGALVPVAGALAVPAAMHEDNLVYHKHYPFTEYKSLEVEKIRVIYAE